MSKPFEAATSLRGACEMTLTPAQEAKPTSSLVVSEQPPLLARFAVSPLRGGPWLVLDRVHADRLVASCPLEDDAHAIAALMNRDPVEALRYIKFSLDKLDFGLPE